MRTRCLLVAAAGGMLTLGMAVPASAATSGVSTATITVQGGFLSITVPPDAGNLSGLVHVLLQQCGGETLEVRRLETPRYGSRPAYDLLPGKRLTHYA